jgi:hypothetical protein
VPLRSRPIAISLVTLGLSAVAAPSAPALPSCAAAPCASDYGRPVVILDYYRGRHLPRLIRAARRSGLPRDTPIYYGSYWGVGVNTRPPPKTPPPPPTPPGKPRPTMPGRRFAPIFSLARTNFWNRRVLPSEDRRTLREHGQDSLRGRIPSLGRLMHRSGHYRYQAGLEVGRRFRDRIRFKRAHHQRVVTWQFDEIPSEIAGRNGYKVRQVVQGILRGVAYGRPALGDVRLPGIVFASGKALRVANRPAHGDLRRFWKAVNEASLFLVGEEYADFVGSPGRAARRHAAWRHSLYRWGGQRRALARKYVAGMTPGYRLVPGLGGNVQRRGRSAVRRWRLSFVRTRARLGVAGFAQYNFNYHNASAAVMNDVLRALGRGVRVLNRR